MIEYYSKYIDETIKLIENTMFATIATANKNGDVSASKVTIVNDGLDIYFQTDSSFEKAKNIKENNKIAINLGATYVKGIAEIIGKPIQNEMFINKMKKKNIHTYNDYSKLENEVLIKVVLTEIRIWKYDKIDGKTEEYLIIIDLNNKISNKIKLDNMSYYE